MGTQPLRHPCSEVEEHASSHSLLIRSSQLQSNEDPITRGADVDLISFVRVLHGVFVAATTGDCGGGNMIHTVYVRQPDNEFSVCCLIQNRKEILG